MNQWAPNSTARVGESLSLAVNVSGQAPFSAAWTKDGNPVTIGAVNDGSAFSRDPEIITLALNIYSATLASSGTYAVTISNALGSVSTTTTLTVNPVILEPVIAPAPVTTATLESPFTYTITAQNNPTGFGWIGDTPPGLTLDQSTGIITGTPHVAGTFNSYLIAYNSAGTVSTPLVIIVDNPGLSARVSNLSARAYVGTGANILIGGFAVGGSGSKEVLLRGAGPGVATSGGVADALPGAQLALLDSAPPPEPAAEAIATNSGWNNNPIPGPSTVSAAVEAATITIMNAVGAFAYQANSLDSAIVATLPVGNYTFQVSGTTAASGIALAEVYDADANGSSARLLNFSARASVGTGNNILIAGFAVSGNTWETVMIRGIGPGLFDNSGLTGYLANPELVLCDSGGNVIASNAGWNAGGVVTGPSTIGAFIDAASPGLMSQVGAFPLQPGSADCAMLFVLPPGNYTAQLSGLGGTSGIGLIEIYEAPYFHL